jgi:hypothetical protein
LQALWFVLLGCYVAHWGVKEHQLRRKLHWITAPLFKIALAHQLREDQQLQQRPEFIGLGHDLEDFKETYASKPL